MTHEHARSLLAPAEDIQTETHPFRYAVSLKWGVPAFIGLFFVLAVVGTR